MPRPIDTTSPLRTDPKVVNWLFLSHHHESRLDRCFHLRCWRARVAICARCLGVYPTLAGMLLLQAGLGWGRTGKLDWLLPIMGIFPALLDWGIGWQGKIRGRNSTRFITGVLLGLALGRSVWLYFIDPLEEIFWIQILLLLIGAISFEILRRLRL
jgi:uncharacterized membrane protein